MELSQEKKIAIVGTSLLLGIVVFVLVFNNTTSKTPTTLEQVETTEEKESETNEEEVVEDNETKDETNEDDQTETEEKKKNPGTNVNVQEKPTIYTGYGNTEQKPLMLDQNTSTSCTTDANVECVLEFTNTDTSSVVTFDAKTTDSTGVAVWQWSGADVGAGKWQVVGKAGSKVSNTGIVYIK